MVYNSLLLNRIEIKIEKILWKNQNVFQWNRSTSKILTNFRRSSGKSMEATLLFVDFSKSFDSKHRGKMEQILAYGLPKETVSHYDTL